MATSTASQASAAADVWLPVPPAQVDGLPDGLTYHYWDGDEEFPADPADCAFYVVPYMKGQAVAVRPLGADDGGAGRADPHRGDRPRRRAPSRDLPAGTLLCNARGVHDASTAELALALTLASLRELPAFVRAQDAESGCPGVHPALADRTVLIVGYGAIGAAVEERLLPFEVEEVLRVARSERTVPRGPVHAARAARPNCCRAPTW